MKKTIFLLLFLIILTACAGLKTTARNMSEDPGSPEKIAMLRERVNDFWTAFEKENYEKVYSLYDPFFRAKHPDRSEVIEKFMGRIKYHNHEVKDIQVEGNIAKVKLSVIYSVPKIKLKTQEFSASVTPADFEETWLFIYDNWYKEFFLQMYEKGFADY